MKSKFQTALLVLLLLFTAAVPGRGALAASDCMPVQKSADLHVLNVSSAARTGWQYINGTWYYFDSHGSKMTGWQYIGGKWYYLSGSGGAMLTGWQYVGGKWYYLNPDGDMTTGWRYLGGKWYYLTSSGAMAIETDVRSTRDGIQVMSHNDALIVDGVEYPLDSWDYADLKKLQSDLCALEEALSVIVASDLYLLLELKSGSNVPLCIDAVKVCGMQDRTTLVSFRKKKLKKAREYDPNIALGLIVGEMPSDVGDTVASLNLSMVCQEYHHLTKDALAAWHDMGLHVNTWTVDSEAQLSRYMKWGVDSITTNYPKLAASAVEP